MDQEWVILRLPTQQLADLRAIAAKAGITPGQYLRDFIAQSAQADTQEIPLPVTKESSVSALREMIEDLLFAATDWTALQEALVAQGFALKAEGYRLMLCAWPSEDPVCKTADLGLSYAELIRRIGAGEPPNPATLSRSVSEDFRQAS